MRRELPLATISQLKRDFTDLGVEPGQTIMLHISVKAIGWIIGGPDVVLDVLLQLLTPKGTLMMYAAWEDRTDHWREWPTERQSAYLAECPPFDPATSRANRKWSILVEYLRTKPGACRSGNPGASMVAIGAEAQWLTNNHPLQYGYGPGSPLEKLCEIGGQVLQVGVPLSTVTLLHYSEHMANVKDKRIVKYLAPILQDGQPTWVEIEEFDTSKGIVDWNEDYFSRVIQEYLASGKGKSGKVGAAQSRLFDAADLRRYATEWMERTFSAHRQSETRA